MLDDGGGSASYCKNTSMKIYWRYIAYELVRPFVFCVVACSALWIVADLFGTLDDFMEKRPPWSLVFQFYAAQTPKILVTVLPVSALFATLFTLTTLARRHETTALEAGGISRWQIHQPFVLLAALCAALLFYLNAFPATHAEATRARILGTVRGTKETSATLCKTLVFRDAAHHRLWYVQTLDVDAKTAEGIEVLQRDDAEQDVQKVFAAHGKWNGRWWQLEETQTVWLSPTGGILQQQTAPTLDMLQWNEAPHTLALVQTKPEEMDLLQLGDLLRLGGGSQTQTWLAPYRTQWHAALSYPATALVLTAFAIAAANRPGQRRGPAAGVFNAIFLLLGYLFVQNFFLALGRSSRIPAFLAAWATPLLFGLAATLWIEYRWNLWPWGRERVTAWRKRAF